MNDILLFLTIVGGLAVVSAIIFRRAGHLVPYIYCGSKVSAWEAKLIPEARFDDLAESRNTKQVLTSLEDTEYQHYIGNISLEGKIEVEEIEECLNFFLRDHYQELLEIIPEERKDVVEKIIGIIDVRNLKGIMTGVSEEIPKEELKRVLVPSSTRPKEKIEMLLSAETIDKLLDYLEGSDYYDAISEALEKRYEKEGVYSLIRALDKAYYGTLWEDVTGKKAQLSVLKNIIGTKLDMINIKLIMRLKREEAQAETIAELLVPSYRLSDEIIKEMTVAESVQSAAEAASDTIYGPTLREGLRQFEKTGSLFQVEKALDEQFLKICREISVGQPFTLASPLTYIYLLETEVRNLRIVTRLKAEGVESRRIKDTLLRKPEIEF